jgi:Asp-tRNA(Asn)/Glu-tRNA(Gln) amidotransferase B subunit
VEAWAQRIPAARFVDLLGRVAAGELTGPNAKEVFEAMAETGEDPAAIVAARGFKVVASAADLLPVIHAVLAENAGPVSQVLAGKTSTFGFLVGQVMKKTGGQAAPQVVQSLLRAELDARAKNAG